MTDTSTDRRHEVLASRAWVSRLASLFSSPLAIFLAAAGMRIAIVLVLHLHQTPFRAEWHRTAESLVTTGVYGNEYLVPTGPSAHTSPVQTLLLAAVYRLFGLGVSGEVAEFALNIAITGLLYALLPSFAVAMAIPRQAGVVAGWLGALVPIHFLNELRGGEGPLAGIVLMSILVSARGIVEGDALDGRQVIRLGLLWGFSLLVLPTLLCVIVAIVGVGFGAQRTKAFVLHIGLAAIVATLILSPWAIRNRLTLGETVWFRSNLGTELRTSYNDVAWPDFDRSVAAGTLSRYHPLSNADAARQIAEEGEVAWNRRQLRETIAWVRANPERSVSLLLHRIVYFWFPRTFRPVQNILLSALSVLALAGVWRLRRQHRTTWLLLLATWASFPLVYYVVQSSVRYRYPMLWTLLLASAALLFVRRDDLPRREGRPS